MSTRSSGDLQPREVARVLAEISTLMELNGRDPFRARAFRSAARSLEASGADLVALARADRLDTLPSVGPAIASIVREIVLTGRSRMHEELHAATPLGLFDLLRIPGLGPKRIHALHATLGVDSLDALESAARAGAIATVPGIGAKTAEKVSAGIAFARSSRARRRYPEALEVAVRLLEWVEERDDVLAAAIVGAVRRRLEVVEGIDLVAACEDPALVLEAFAALNGEAASNDEPGVAAVRLSDGLPVRLRCVEPERFVAAVVWETGSPDHLTELGARARELGLALDADGLSRGSERIPLAEEPALYSALGLEYLPPELREGMGEVRAAIGAAPFGLVAEEDLRGTFHCHTTYSDGKATLVEMAEAARARGWSYLGIADHSRTASYAGGLSEETIRAQHAEIDELNLAEARRAGKGKRKRGRGADVPFRLFKGIESDILADGSLDYPDEILATFDYVVASIHSAFAMPEREMTERVVRAVTNPFLTILGHPTGRLLLTRKGYAIDIRKVIDVAAERGVVIEINSNPHRLDLDWREVRYAVERGVLIAINPDAHSVVALDHVAFGVNMARKAGLDPERVLNCWSLEEVERYFAQRRKAGPD